MRTKRTILNLAYTLGTSVLLLLLSLVTRRLLVFNFGDEIAGAATVVEKMFMVFSIAEFGVGNVISYRLYEQVVADDHEKISKYMSMYKWAYRVVGGVIAVLAAFGALALPWMLPDTPPATAYLVYVLNVISTLASYFLITRRLMYTCTQQGYICTRIDFWFNIGIYIARICIALWLPNYLLYQGTTILLNIGANLVVARRFRKDFPYVHDCKVTLEDFKSLGIFHDLKHYLVHRLSDTIYGTSDALVSSRMGGATLVTNLGSYTAISDNATNIGNKIMSSFSAAIGNIVYDKTAGANAHDKEVFWGLDLCSYFFASFVAVAYLCLFQPFMTLWMGHDRLLPLGFVLAFSLNEYVGWNHKMLGSYRAVLGHFEEDQWFMVASATLNLLLSFLLYRPLGVAGILVATVLAHSIMWVGRCRVVCRHYMVGSGRRYLRVQLTHLATMAALMASASALCGLLPGGFAGLALRAVVVLVLPNTVNLALYGWTKDAAYLRGVAGGAVKKLTQRGKNA